jgi:hypothetical protein
MRLLRTADNQAARVTGVCSGAHTCQWIVSTLRLARSAHDRLSPTRFTVVFCRRFESCALASLTRLAHTHARATIIDMKAL